MDTADLEAAIEAGAKALHDAARPKKRTLRWETSSETYRQDLRDLVRPVVIAALATTNKAAAPEGTTAQFVLT